MRRASSAFYAPPPPRLEALIWAALALGCLILLTLFVSSLRGAQLSRGSDRYRVLRPERSQQLASQAGSLRSRLYHHGRSARRRRRLHGAPVPRVVARGKV